MPGWALPTDLPADLDREAARRGSTRSAQLALASRRELEQQDPRELDALLEQARAPMRSAGAAEVLATEERLAAARVAQQLRAAERGRLMEVVGGIVTDTLLGLTVGRLDPADPHVRRTCRRDARLLRAFLHQAGDGDQLLLELFARAVRLRGRGVDLDVRGDLPRDTVSPHDRARLLGPVDHWLGRAQACG